MEPHTPRGSRILIVDDEEDILQSMLDLFEVSLEGVECVTAPDGPAALEVLASQPIDLIVSDYKMPGMDGLEFLGKAHALAPKVPRVMMTAFPDLDIAIQAINEAHITTFFTKPLDPDKVIETVRDLLSDRRAGGMRDQALSRAMDALRRRGG